MIVDVAIVAGVAVFIQLFAFAVGYGRLAQKVDQLDGRMTHVERGLDWLMKLNGKTTA